MYKETRSVIPIHSSDQCVFQEFRKQHQQICVSSYPSSGQSLILLLSFLSYMVGSSILSIYQVLVFPLPMFHLFLLFDMVDGSILSLYHSFDLFRNRNSEQWTFLYHSFFIPLSSFLCHKKKEKKCQCLPSSCFPYSCCVRSDSSFLPLHPGVSLAHFFP